MNRRGIKALTACSMLGRLVVYEVARSRGSSAMVFEEK